MGDSERKKERKEIAFLFYDLLAFHNVTSRFWLIRDFTSLFIKARLVTQQWYCRSVCATESTKITHMWNLITCRLVSKLMYI